MNYRSAENGIITPVETVVKVKGLEKSVRILHVTDVHLCLSDGSERQDREELNVKRAELFTKDGVKSDERFPLYFELASEANCDAVIMTGDVADEPFPKNIRVIEDAVKASPVPALFCVGNHDWCFFDGYRTADAARDYLPLYKKLCGGDVDHNITEIGGLAVLTLHNGNDTFTVPQCDVLDELTKKEKPVVICFHVPIRQEGLSPLAAAFWGADNCLGEGGAANTPETARFINLIKERSDKIAAVICGHLHFSHEEPLFNTVQIVTGLAAFGQCRIITFEPTD